MNSDIQKQTQTPDFEEIYEKDPSLYSDLGQILLNFRDEYETAPTLKPISKAVDAIISRVVLALVTTQSKDEPMTESEKEKLIWADRQFLQEQLWPRRVPDDYENNHNGDFLGVVGALIDQVAALRIAVNELSRKGNHDG